VKSSPKGSGPRALSRLSRYRPLIIAVVFLLIAASRIPRLPGLEPDVDEAWSIWQTFGTPQQIIHWTPYDWPPLSYLTIGAWKGLVGIHPVVVRLLSVYIFMIGGALLYRVARKLHGHDAALIALIGYGAFGFGFTISTWIRGYVIVLALTPLALWLAIRYFERPTILRAVLLAISLAAMFYTHSTSVIAIGMIGLYTLVLYSKAIWRWWLPGAILILLALPELANKLRVTAERASSVERLAAPPILQAVGGLYAIFAGWGAIVNVWAVLFVIATALILYRQRITRPVLALLLWVLTPIAMYLLLPVIGIFSQSHLIWVMVGVVIWIGWGLSYLPRPALTVCGVVLALAMFWPLRPDERIYRPTLSANMQALTRDIQWGDVILIDPNCDTATPDEWAYYTQVYFPGGLRFVTDPAGYRRVWYVKIDGKQDPATEQRVRANRIEGEFFGPWNFLFRLYEAPPDIKGILFDNGMRFHGSEIVGVVTPGMPVYREAETVRVRLWWSADRRVDRDYSVSVFARDWQSGETLAQLDSAPQITNGPQATRQWEPGRYYVEARDLTLPDKVRAGRHTVYLTVYQWWDNVRVAAPGVDADRLLAIQRFDVKSW